MTRKEFTGINNLLCTRSEDGLFTVGEIYSVNPYYSKQGNLIIIGNSQQAVYVSPETLRPVGLSGYQFELVEESPAISDEYEEEEWIRIGKSHLKKSYTEELSKNLQEAASELWKERFGEIEKQSEEVCCDVALAYQLSQIQKYIREYDSNIELIVYKDFIAINDENGREYRGNVEQVIRFIKASGELAKVSDEMDRRN